MILLKRVQELHPAIQINDSAKRVQKLHPDIQINDSAC
jgi:hypothetical protein